MIKEAIKERAKKVKNYFAELMSKNGKIGSVIYKIKTKICELATKVKTYVVEHINIIKNSIHRGLRITRVFIKREIINRFIKFPARRFIEWMKRRIARFLGKKAAKAGAKSAIKTLIKSLVKILAKYFTKIAVKIMSGLVKAAGLVVTGVGALLELAITYGWLMYDIFKMYQNIK